jgi:hypothetical protein
MEKKRRRTTEELTIAMQRQITELALRLAAVHLVLNRKGILKVRDYVAARKESRPVWPLTGPSIRKPLDARTAGCSGGGRRG